MVGSVDAIPAGEPDKADVAGETRRSQPEPDVDGRAPDQDERRGLRRARFRRVGVAALVLLFAILVPVTVAATWVHRVVLNETAYVNVITPIAQNPTVTAAVSQQLTNDIYAAVDPQQVLSDALPPKAAPLAVPLANAVKGYLQSSIDKLISSPKFQELWVSANTFAHRQLVSALKGDSPQLSTTNGQVVLNLVPLLDEALKAVQTQAPILVEKNITLPTISGDEIPAAACARIGAALHLSLPATCGQVRLIPAAQLASARRAVRLFEPAVIALIIITPLIAIAALLLSQRRRRTLLQLCIGGMLGVIVLRRIVMWLQSQLIGHVKEENRAAVSIIVQTVLHGLLTVTLWLLVGGLILVLLALVTGPYRWAVAGRSAVSRAFRGTGHLVSTAGGQVHGDRTTSWVGAHLDVMRIGGVVVAALVVLLTDVNVIGIVVVIVLLGLYELLLSRTRPDDDPGVQDAEMPA